MTRPYQFSRHRNPRNRRKGSVIVEYLLLCTIVGIGVLVGLAAVRAALVTELQDIASAIEGIS